MAGFFDIAVRGIDGSADLLGGLRGKVVLAVNVVFAGDIEWNFEKFLIGRDGRVLKRYPPPTKPQDSGLLQDIADAI